ncbi:MAG: hypothetical protein WBV96_18655, partial [Polyangia bacterium]
MTKCFPLSVGIAASLLGIVVLTSCTGSESGGTAPAGGSLDANAGGSGGTAGVTASTATDSGGRTSTGGGVQPTGGSGG